MGNVIPYEVSAQPHEEGLKMIKKNSISGTYSFVKPYMGVDMMRPMGSASYTTNRGSKSMSYNLNLGSSSTYNKMPEGMYKTEALYSGLRMSDPLSDMLMKYR